jgi:hypothetical protein
MGLGAFALSFAEAATATGLDGVKASPLLRGAGPVLEPKGKFFTVDFGTVLPADAGGLAPAEDYAYVLASSASCANSAAGVCDPAPGSPDGLNASQTPSVNLTQSGTVNDTPGVLYNDINATRSFSTAEQYASCYDSRYGVLYIAASDGTIRVSPLDQGQRTILTDASAASKALVGYVGESRMTPATLTFDLAEITAMAVVPDDAPRGARMYLLHKDSGDAPHLLVAWTPTRPARTR